MIYKTNEAKEIRLFSKGWLRELKLKEPNDLFADFYQMRNKEDMNDDQKAYMAEIIEETFGEAE